MNLSNIITVNERFESSINLKLDLENNKILYEGSPFSYWLAFPAYQDKNISGEEAYAQSNKLYTIDYYFLILWHRNKYQWLQHYCNR